MLVIDDKVEKIELFSYVLDFKITSFLWDIEMSLFVVFKISHSLGLLGFCQKGTT